MAAREPTFELAAALAKKGFTPGARDIPALLELAATEDVGGKAGPALVALGARAQVVERAASERDEGLRARLVTVIGMFARGTDPDARDVLVAMLAAAVPGRVRRAAVVALGKVGDDVAREALVARWDAAGDAMAPDEKRALAEALGKVGGEAALARLGALDAGADAELARRRDRALLMAERTAKRGDESTIVTAVAPPAPVIVQLSTRGGLAGLLVEELAALGRKATAVTDGTVRLDLAEPLEVLFASRLWVGVSVRIPLVTGGELVDAIVKTLTSAPVRALLRAWTHGAIRWRLGFAHGHKRAVVWNVAKVVTAAAPELINDPTGTTWDVLVDDAARVLDGRGAAAGRCGWLELVPRRLDDPRFAWRVAEVPAASHPTVAAALARVAEIRVGQRVWDPFCGSGAELVECARRVPSAVLLGSDVDDAALAASRANLDAAGVQAELMKWDARHDGPTLVEHVITNPPLGSRVHVDAAALLESALPNLVARLGNHGRLTWITPAFRRTGPVLERLGLHKIRSWPIDLGGVRGHLERWDR